MNKKIKSALISVFYKDGLPSFLSLLHQSQIKIYSTGGTQQFIESHKIPCIPVESLTGYPSILGGRVKTLHPLIFGGILGRRNIEKDAEEMKQYHIPEIDLVIVDLYPFEKTLEEQNQKELSTGLKPDEEQIIEKIDIGGPSMIRAAAKNFKDVLVIASKNDYPALVKILLEQDGETTLAQRKSFAAKAFDVCTGYDISISNYFNQTKFLNPFAVQKHRLRYGENPHQQAEFYGNTDEVFHQLSGKELSYNNLVDVNAAIDLLKDITSSTDDFFAIIKHTNVCGAALRKNISEAWEAAFQGDPESAFGGVLITKGIINKETASAINDIFFEVLIAPSFEEEALLILKSKKNRILLQLINTSVSSRQYKSVLNGMLQQENDPGNFENWNETGCRPSSEEEREDLKFANIVCKHLKSNAIALVKNKQLIGKGCGQTSRIDALRHAIAKAQQFHFNLKGAVLASDAFFPFDDCVKIAHEAGISAFIQPGGSIRDKDSIEYCKKNDLVMVLTGMRHFKH